MQEVFEKIIEKLDESKEHYRKQWNKYLEDEDYGNLSAYEDAIKIVKQVAEEYKECTLCYLQSPCEYQNKDCKIPEK